MDDVFGTLSTIARAHNRPYHVSAARERLQLVRNAIAACTTREVTPASKAELEAWCEAIDYAVAQIEAIR